jgi:hypothetical protein
MTAASTVTLDTSPSVVSVTLNNASAKLISDGGAHTLTTSTGITVTQGTVDFSAGSNPTNKVTLVTTTSGDAMLTAAPSGGTATVNLSHTIQEPTAADAVVLNGGSGTVVFTELNFEVISPVHAINSTLVNNGVVGDGYFSGVTATNTINFNSSNYSGWDVFNNTELGVVANGYILAGLAGDDNLTFEGNWVQQESTNTYSRGLLSPGITNSPTASSVVSYNGYTGHGASSTYGLSIGGCSSTVTYPCLVHHNVTEYGWEGINFTNCSYCRLSYNTMSQDARSAVGQGCDFSYQSSDVSIIRDICANVPTDASGNILFFALGNGTSIPTNWSVDHTLGINGGGILYGETGSGLNGLLGLFTNNIEVAGAHGDEAYASGNSANTWLTTGTGGVGAANNLAYGTWSTGAAWSNVGNVASFGTGHPSATYGDSTLNPMLVSQWTTLAAVDSVLGGPGTEADLFTQLSNRWNGTNGAPFTPQNIWQAMTAPYAPLNLSVASLDSSGSYLGPVAPVVMGGWAQ